MGPNTDNVTSAFYDSQTKQTFCVKLDYRSSIFTAECYAIFRTLLYIIDVNSLNFLVVTASKCVLLALEGNLQKSSTNYILINIKKLLIDLGNRGKRVLFKWVPSHCGITGNEVADGAARGAFDENQTDAVKIPLTDFHQQINESVTLLWHSYWKKIAEKLISHGKRGKTTTNKTGAFLASIAGISAIVGFSATLSAAKKRDPKYFNKGLHSSVEVADAGAILALRALGWGTLYAVAGTTCFCYGIYKLSGAKNRIP
ncbi:hypothetical protein evm_014321 [Chilo suppressalis]|nr:hypothetical protein evm_014321 [Chilo suppressalis]